VAEWKSGTLQFYIPRRPLESARKGVGRKRNSNPLREGPKLGTCAADFWDREYANQIQQNYSSRMAWRAHAGSLSGVGAKAIVENEDKLKGERRVSEDEWGDELYLKAARVG
jgi:hypothetical protein